MWKIPHKQRSKQVKPSIPEIDFMRVMTHDSYGL